MMQFIRYKVKVRVSVGASLTWGPRMRQGFMTQSWKLQPSACEFPVRVRVKVGVGVEREAGLIRFSPMRKSTLLISQAVRSASVLDRG